MSWKAVLGSVAGGAAALVAGCSPTPLDEPVTGQRSFLVTSTLSASDGSDISPASHAFTMVVDSDAMTAIAGAFGIGASDSIVSSAGEQHWAGRPLDLPVTTGACPPTVRYNNLSFTVGESGSLVGHGTGQLTTNNGGVRANQAVTMSLAGVADAVPPTLTWPRVNDVTDPFTVLFVMSSEPLPDRSAPVLRAAGGDVTALANADLPPFGFYFGVKQPAVLRRYGEQYTVDIAGVRDFAGNVALTSEPQGLTLTTRPAPPLVASDGFEAVTGTTLGGAQVLSGAGDPVISGRRSLYVPGPALGATMNFAVRLAVRPGAQAVKLAYRYVNGDGKYFYSIRVASVGGQIWTIDLQPGDEPMTSGMIGETRVMLGAIQLLTFELPADASDEIVISHTVANLVNECELPVALPPLPGFIIDDLRSE
jgi:hypothetical protein